VVFVVTRVSSAVLETPLPSGVLPRTPPPQPGPAAWATTMAMCPGLAVFLQLVPPSVASEIDDLCI
jgi:hypothetical protein